MIRLTSSVALVVVMLFQCHSLSAGGEFPRRWNGFFRPAILPGWAVTQIPLADRQVAPAPFEKKLEYADDVAMAVRLVGEFEDAVVLRWQGGIPKGWVYFQEGKETKKSDIGVEESVKRKTINGKVWDPKSHSGWIIIAVKASGMKGSKTRECVISVVIQQRSFRGKELENSTWGYGRSGTIPAPKLRWRGMDSGPRRFQASSEFTTVDGNDYDYFNITLE